MNDKLCEYCGTALEHNPNNPRKRFCSGKCASAVLSEKAAWRKPKPCRFCGEIFEPERKHQRFCGNSCRQKYEVRKYPHVCIECGKTFYPGTRNVKYCSRECRAKKKVAWRTEKRICAHCGSEYEPKTKSQTCCSLACGRATSADKVRLSKSSWQINMDHGDACELLFDLYCLQRGIACFRPVRNNNPIVDRVIETEQGFKGVQIKKAYHGSSQGSYARVTLGRSNKNKAWALVKPTDMLACISLDHMVVWLISWSEIGDRSCVCLRSEEACDVFPETSSASLTIAV